MHGWEDNIKMDLRGTGYEVSEQGLIMGFCEHGNEHSGSTEAGNFLTS
jgi:hypothetical protein